MGPVQPAGNGATYSLSMLRAGHSAPRPGAGVSRGGAAAPSTSGQTGTAGSVMLINTAVMQILRSIGGGIENDKLLRLMIALLILLTLLGHQQEQQAQTQSAWGGSSTGNAGSYSFAGLCTSSATTSVEQSYASVVIADGYGSSGPSSDASPTQLDSVA